VLIGPIGYGDEEFMAEYGYIEIKPTKLRPIALGGKAALLRAVRILVIFDIIDILDNIHIFLVGTCSYVCSYVG
jgi:hypothetical protein